MTAAAPILATPATVPGPPGRTRWCHGGAGTL